ncbi:MAG: glycosyl transferase [Microgenomates bacterium 39_6]|nr:MAG: glycosyl transferase [Microgenomates bacterium 39_6]
MVDDYPPFNLAVKGEALKKVGGFSCQFWPGEDTKLCLDLVYQLDKKIVYDPGSIVFHHRRKIFLPHLKQLGRYGYHRGLFVKLFPQTSKRLGYFLPALFSLGLIFGPPTYFVFRFLKLFFWADLIKTVFLTGLGLYAFLLVINSLWVLVKSKKPGVALLLLLVIPISHLYYGLRFLQGLFLHPRGVKGHS